MQGALIAFDLGTTHLKWVVTDLSGMTIFRRGQGDSGVRTLGHHSEQDPLAIYRRIVDVLRDAATQWNIRRLSFSCAMHSLVVVDEHGTPLTPSLTWMDSRALPTAQYLRHRGVMRDLQRQSGVPLHAMSPLVKWIHVRSALPPTARPVSLKDYLVFRLTNQWHTDYSTASASGFLSLNGEWHPLALEYGHLSQADLPAVHPMRFAIPDNTGHFEVIVGGNDAATAHVHLHIPIDQGVGVLAMGTSGALRTTSAHPIEASELFCYTLGPDNGYLVGSAFSNVGNFLSWMARLFSLSVAEVVSLGKNAIDRDDALPMAIPYLYGERSPWWREDLHAEWRNLSPRHGRDHILGSALLSLAAVYYRGLQALERTGRSLSEIRAGSGLLENELLAQFLADALDRSLALVDSEDASLMGAIDLATEKAAIEDPPVRRHYVPQNSRVHRRTGERAHMLDAYHTTLP